MPNIGLAKSFLKTADKLAPAHGKRVSEADIRCSISTSYFAVFHALALVAANSLVGNRKSSRPNKAWVEVYRGISHTSAKDACKKSKNVEFPDEIHNFANTFVQLQDFRKRADYDPTCRPNVEDARFALAMAQICVETLNSSQRTDKIAFSTWVLITSPGAKQAREVVQQKLGPNMRNGD